MRLISFLKPGLFIYECLRILILTLILVFQGGDSGHFIRVLFTAPSALFPLMALFIWLDTDRYNVYLPLFAAGKGIGIFLELGWSIISQQATIIGSSNISVVLTQLILSGDLFALAACLMIIKDVRKLEENKCVLSQSQAEKAE